MFRINTQGTAYLEYLMLALLVFVATVGITGFFTSNLKAEGGAARSSIKNAFYAGCEVVLDGANCQ